MSNGILRNIRITLALICFILVNILFLGISWGITRYISWMAKIQFIPALLALDYAVLSLLIIITFVFGRIYCSTICPLGVMQDIFGWFGKKNRKNRYRHSVENKWLRYSVWAVFVICLFIGFAPVTTLIAPYSSYGRIVNSLFKPLYDLLNNGMAMIESNYDSYIFSSVDIWMRSISTFVIALLTFILLFILAWRNGRTYCNNICPVGTTLGFLSRFSIFKVHLDKNKCKNCSLCERNCKTSAIDYKNGTIDYSCCVVCGDCLNKCKHDALHYTPLKHIGKSNESKKEDNTATEGVDVNRRAFLVGGATAIATAAASQTRIKVDGGLAIIEDKKAPVRHTPITPPGSISAYNMTRHCTACQLCVSTCPNNVLRPSTDTMTMMQPVMSFERGYCRTECTRCSQVCPTGAIKRINREEKTSIHIGHAMWIESNCIPVVNGDSCGNCARHCPAWAIQMVEREMNGRLVNIPVVDAEKCIGCGACENLCPARPFSAIYVEGYKMHHIS